MRSINKTQFYRQACKFYRLCLSFSVFFFCAIYPIYLNIRIIKHWYQSYFTAHREPNISLASFCGEKSSLPLRVHRWCPQRYMGRAKRALIKGFDQKKTHHLPSSPPFCTQRICGQKDAGQVPYKNGRFAMNNWRKDLKQREQKVWA